MKKKKDHYVAQTYLKWFRNQQETLYVYNKHQSNIKEKTSAQICYELGGSDNPFLQKDRAIEDYLKNVENRWNDSIELLASPGNVDFKQYLEAKYVISAYIAYLRVSTPAAVRVQQESLEAQVKTPMDGVGKLPKPPKGYEFLMEDIERNINVNVDGKFPKAIAAGVLAENAKKMYRSAWMWVENHGDVPFITSDNPPCFWYNESEHLPTTYLPLTPKIGVLIKPFTNQNREDAYHHSEDESRIAKPEFVALLNEQVIKHAEKIVISNQRSDDLLTKVTKFKNWIYICQINKMPSNDKVLVINTLKVTEIVNVK